MFNVFWLSFQNSVKFNIMKCVRRYTIIIIGLFSLFIINSNAKPVTIVSWGGAYTEMQRLGPADYAEKKTGIKFLLSSVTLNESSIAFASHSTLPF